MVLASVIQEVSQPVESGRAIKLYNCNKRSALCILFKCAGVCTAYPLISMDTREWYNRIVGLTVVLPPVYYTHNGVGLCVVGLYNLELPNNNYVAYIKNIIVII